jgi:hypothetical protein
MKVCFTLDDGLKSQIQFWNSVQVPATYFVLPETAEAKTRFYDELHSPMCRWNDIRYLAKNNEMGYHGFSTFYDEIGPEKTKKRIEHGLLLFEENVGVHPVSFAYTNMRAAQIEVISTIFPFNRDYYWRDKVKDDNGEVTQVFRMPREDVPEEYRKWENKIICIHPFKSVLGALGQVKEMEKAGYEYCVIILHAIEPIHIEISKALKTVWDCVTFREIFEGQSVADNSGKPQPALGSNEAASTGATPVASPKEK